MNTVDTNLPRPARDAGIYRKRVDSIAITAVIITICNPIHVGDWAALQQCPEMTRTALIELGLWGGSGSCI